MNLGPHPGKMDQKNTWKVDLRHMSLRQQAMEMGEDFRISLGSLIGDLWSEDGLQV